MIVPLSVGCKMQYSVETAKLISMLAVKRLRELCGDLNHRYSEAMLVRNEIFCGLRYRAGRFRAEWMNGTDVIRIYRDSELFETYPIVRSNQPRRAA